ncbi:MAG: hypothetical protein ABR532_03245 [Candidatus Dormibacteria bacterium]
MLTPDSARTILVISCDGELAVGLRDRLDPAFALVKDVRPEEALDGLSSCVPWPWMVAGDVSPLPATVIQRLCRHPILILWRGDPPRGLPRHARAFTAFAPLATAAETALRRSVSGMRLAAGLGVELPGGAYARSAELQALISSHPDPLDLPLKSFRSAARVLTSRRIPCRPALDRAGTVSLVEATAGTRRE